MTDIRPPAPSAPAAAVPEVPQPAVPEPVPVTVEPPKASTPVIDLRDAAAASPPTPEPPQPVVTPIAPAAPPAPIVQAPTVNGAVAAKVEARLSRAASVEKSQLIQKFTKPAAPSAAPVQPTAAAQPTSLPTATPPPAPTVQPPPVPALPPTPAPVAPSNLPAPVATQVDAMAAKVNQELDDPKARAETRQAAFQMAMTGPKPTTVAAVAIAIALMGGFVWYRNYPNMAARVASSRAGIDAELPAYIPASYSLKGPISYSPGQVRFRFGSATGESLLVSARRTNWDSASLLENYVSEQADDYLAVQSQGLTIYFYNGNQASWINRGLWYSIEGQTKLNREQVLRIIDSL